MAQKTSTAPKAMTLGKGIYQLLLNSNRFQQELTTIKTDLRELGDRLQEQLEVGFSQINQPTLEDVPEPDLDAFPCLRVLNRLEQLTLDKTPKRHEAQFNQCQKLLEEDCPNCLPPEQDWKSEFIALCQPFALEDLTSPEGIQERTQRYQKIQQLRVKVLQGCGVSETDHAGALIESNASSDKQSTSGEQPASQSHDVVDVK